MHGPGTPRGVYRQSPRHNAQGLYLASFRSVAVCWAKTLCNLTLQISTAFTACLDSGKAFLISVFSSRRHLYAQQGM